MSGRRTCRRPLCPDESCDALTVICRITEQGLSALGPPQIQMCRVFPCEADPTMNLDVLVGAVCEGIRTPRFGDAGSQREVCVVIVSRPKTLVSRRSRALDLKQHIGALVLDRLERADRSAE